MAQAQQQLVHGHPGRHTCSAPRSPAPLRNLVHEPRRTLHRGLADGGGSLGPGLNSRGLDTDYIIAISGGCGSVLLLIILAVIDPQGAAPGQGAGPWPQGVCSGHVRGGLLPRYQAEQARAGGRHHRQQGQRGVHLEICL